MKYQKPIRYGYDVRHEPSKPRNLLFTVREAKHFGIAIDDKPVGFEWDETFCDPPRRRGLYMGRPYCPALLKYVKWWATNELNLTEDVLAELRPDEEALERLYSARREMAKRLLWQAEAGWVDIEFYEIEPDVQDGYIRDMWLLNPERLQRERGRD